MSFDKAFLPWVEAKGVKMKGIAPKIIPTRGIGVVATRDIRPHEVIMSVPARSLRTIDSVPKNITKALPGVSVHGILAAEMALDDSEDFKTWSIVLPTKQDLEAGMPMMWPKELQKLLPTRARELLDKQLANFHRESDLVLKAFPKLKRDDYLYYWVLVNTRTFYNSSPKMKTYPLQDRLVCMPAADLFNHADHGCELQYSAAGYGIAADRAYTAGEEVFVSYGSHSNDFLLTEYGFILDTNCWDEVYLDDPILAMLTKVQRADLKAVGFLGRYTIDVKTPGCHRTQVALRMLCCTMWQWSRFLNAESDGQSTQREVDEFLLQALNSYLGTARDAMRSIDGLEVGLDIQRDWLRSRWEQIETMVKNTIEQLES